ncbi:MAG: formyltetrahydrofolate deformylase [Desulfovibrio sp.]|uniref:formyltetrahydrofolate deformylase n=1 Tax=Desulfovibrio sp. 7SRBS1 TaxID=3378064 RepID=UPI003B3FA625
MDLETTARLLIKCRDEAGIVAAVTSFLHHHGANITALDQHTTDPFGGMFFMRLEFQTPHLIITKDALEDAFGKVVAQRFDMDWTMSYATPPKRAALFVSGHDHCLMELLWRWTRDELPMDVAAVVSNHPVLKEAVEHFGVPYHYVPLSKENKAEAEDAILDIIKDTDFVVLARYMQILSADFLGRYGKPVINIHHSFLPAFVGADPYRQARERGVKIIGATAHYVTEELDGGPIIEQDVSRVSHRQDIAQLRELGRDIERRVLARAVTWHCQDRVLLHDNKTVVF